MTRWAMVAVCLLALVAAAMAAGDNCPSCQADEQKECLSCQSGHTSGNEAADNLAVVVREDTRRERIETMQEWGFSLQELQLIRAYKARMHRLKEQLDDALQTLAVVMYSRYEDPQQRLEAAQKALQRCQELQREDERLQQELIERVGAADDPVKMAGLILLGAVGGGRRTLCEVHVGVAGGAQATGGALPGPQLRHTLGGPPRPRRAWGWWWRRPGARGTWQPLGTQQGGR